jgi:transcriptional regulator with XRE-family HTH domain
MQRAMVHVGTRLRRLRQREALTQDDLAQKAGLTTATVARAERNERQPHMTTLRKLADALGVHPSALIEDENGGKRRDA